MHENIVTLNSADIGSYAWTNAENDVFGTPLP